MATKALSLLAVVLIGLSNLGFSWYSNTIEVTPKDICTTLQSNGITTNCQEGTPWAFESWSHESQWRFYPTSPELFGCYKGSSTGLPVRCNFEGTIIKFASVIDLNKALYHIDRVNHLENLDPKADIVKADTTLEQYTLYKFNRLRIVLFIPRTENGIHVQKVIEGLYGPSDE